MPVNVTDARPRASELELRFESLASRVCELIALSGARMRVPDTPCDSGGKVIDVLDDAAMLSNVRQHGLLNECALPGDLLAGDCHLGRHVEEAVDKAMDSLRHPTSGTCRRHGDAVVDVDLNVQTSLGAELVQEAPDRGHRDVLVLNRRHENTPIHPW